MNIALLTDGIYPYAMGGMQKHSYYLTKYLAANKINVHLYHFAQNTSYDIHQLEFFSDSEKQYIHPYIVPFQQLSKLPGHYLKESFQHSNSIYTTLKKNPPVDFIYAQGFTGWKIIEAKKKGEKLPPIAVNFHGMEPFQKTVGIRAKLQQQLLIGAMRYNLQNADQVFSLGGNLTKILLKQHIPAAKISQIAIGLEEAWINSNPNIENATLRFVFVGRYERRKGIEELNKALQKIIGKEKFEFHFIDSIPDKKRIESAQLIYHGSIVEQDKIRNILQNADVLVCPSFSEGMPTVILEAMASGLAVVATDVGAVNELVSSKSGWLLHGHSIKLLADTLKTVVHCPKEILLQKKQAARDLVKEKYLWDTIIAQTMQAIQEKIQKK